MVGLIADIGGTNVRFALVESDGSWRDVVALRCAEFPGPAQAAAHYLAQLGGPVALQQAAFAVACPVDGDQINLTNSAWHFSVAEVQSRLGVDRLHVVNDFTAVALSVPFLGEGDKVQVGGGQAIPGAAIAVMGPGTGLGVSGLVQDHSGGWIPLAAEGGHVSLPVQNEQEFAVLQQLSRRFGHVSAERVLSGPGLVNLYEALSSLQQRPAQFTTPDAVTGRALDGSCPVCFQALQMFFALLGNVAGNLALTLGAKGGVYLAGGILPRMVKALEQSAFRSQFESKGRFQPYLATIPVWLMVHPQPAFAGLSGLVTVTAV